MSDHAILINGEVAQTVSVFDRGLQFGDGLFETIALLDGQSPFWAAHMRRLRQGCQRLGITAPDTDQLLDEARQVCAGQSRAIVKTIITRGISGRGYAFDDNLMPNRIVMCAPYPSLPASYWEQGVAVTLCKTSLAQQPRLTGLKHLNRLEQVLARAELSGLDVQEGLVCDTAGHVIEATAHNLFIYNNNEFVTPSLVSAGIAGIMREQVLDWLGRNGHTIDIRDITLEDVHGAQGVFLCNSVHGIWPVHRFDMTHYTVPIAVKDLTRAIAKQLPYQ